MTTVADGLLDRDPRKDCYRSVLDALGEAVFVHEAADGRLLYCNDQARRMYGYSLDEMLHSDIEKWSAGTPPYRQQDALTHLALARQTRMPQRFEWLARHHSGALFWVDVTARYLHQEEGDRFVVTVREIRDLKPADEELRASAERLRNLMSRVPGVAIQGYRSDGTVIFWNQASEQLYGYTEAEALGRNLLDLIIPTELREEVVAAVKAMMTTGVDHPPGEISLLRKDGSRVTVYSNHVALRLPGQPPEFFCMDMDLTELHRLAQERMDLERKLLHTQKLESLGVLAGGIAHDFNNLLTAMLGNLDLALRDVSPASPAHPCLKDALVAVHRASDLTRQMLAYSGKGQFVLQEISLNQLVEENINILHTAICKTASLNLALHPLLPAIRGDVGQLQQVVMNLITNASDALENQPGHILLTTGETEMTMEQLSHSRTDTKPLPGRYVYLEVKDGGCGMDEATQARLFDPFFTTKRAGRGLGLSAVLGIVRGHAGAILVDSTPGMGTCIRVAFPSLSTPTLKPPEVESGLTTEVRSSLAGLRILLVDDEAGIRLFGQRSLSRLGAQVLVAENGLDALALAHDHAGTLSCAVVDLTMPQMDGLSCLRVLKQKYPELPVILSSGYTQEDVVRRLGMLAMDGFISKPYESDTLAREIARVVAHATSARAQI